MSTPNMRNLVFISHANPEENEFTRWLALQLTREGYQVWTDVTKLIGGEYWWNDIEDAIRGDTIKFLFILSRASNKKEGTLNELQLAHTVAKQTHINDFILPLRVDDLPFSDINVLLHRLNTIDFNNSWAEGLNKVLKKLSKDSVPRDIDHFNPTTVTSWWKSHRDGYELISEQNEEYFTNWLRIKDLPESIYLHRRNFTWLTKDPERFPFYQHEGFIISFASARDLELKGTNSVKVTTKDFTDNNFNGVTIPIEIRLNILTNILRQAWTNYISDIGLPKYVLANEKDCFYFTQELLGLKKQISFSFDKDISGRRNLVGTFRKKCWHFGISTNVQIYPIMAYIIQYHVLFSDDGEIIWDLPTRLHAARRSACKNWWNAEWRDRLLATLYWLREQGGQEQLFLPVSSKLRIIAELPPIIFLSPLSYNEEYVTYDPDMLDEVRDINEIEIDDEDTI